jgi:glycerate dehydrogenase
VDVDAARQMKILVCNVPSYGTDSVAQHTFALILELTNLVGKNSETVRQGQWSHAPDWCYSVKPLVELSGKTIGIIGFGRIGQKVAQIAEAFGMRVIYFNPSPKDTSYTRVSLKELFVTSDIVSLHCPLKSDNQSFVNKELISLMKPTAFLINTSRGQLIHEHDLAEALKSKKISAAALDVLSKEPPPAGHPLTGLDNCMITPHNAWLSVEARSRIMEITFRNVDAFLKGNPQNIVS